MSLLETIRKQEEKERDIIKRHGGTNIEHYDLINNEGYTFNIGVVRVDARHWRNCYGADVNFWSVLNSNYNTDDITIVKAMKDIESELNEVI